MSRDRGNRLQNALAAYLTRWWEHAESAGAGRNGTDVLGTPGVAWECKTAVDFKRDFRPAQWVAQAKSHAVLHAEWVEFGADPDLEPPVSAVVYFPPGIGKENTGNAMAIVPLHVLMRVLQEAGYTPENTKTQGCTA